MRQSLQPSRHPDDYRFVHRIRTRFAETDAMGIVHHAAYLPYLEEARVAYLRHVGHPYDEVRRGGCNFAALYWEPPYAEIPIIPTFPSHHGWAATHSTAS